LFEVDPESPLEQPGRADAHRVWAREDRQVDTGGGSGHVLAGGSTLGTLGGAAAGAAIGNQINK